MSPFFWPLNRSAGGLLAVLVESGVICNLVNGRAVGDYVVAYAIPQPGQ